MYHEFEKNLHDEAAQVSVVLQGRTFIDWGRKIIKNINISLYK